MRILFIIMLFAVCSKASLGCSCIQSEDYSIKAEFKSTDVVFLGNLVSIDSIAKEKDGVSDAEDEEIWYTFQVTELYKGRAKQNTLRIRSGSIGVDDCKFVFSMTKSYVVYANHPLNEKWKKDKSILVTSICTNTGLATEKKVSEVQKLGIHD